jgi:hypothetical protein
MKKNSIITLLILILPLLLLLLPLSFATTTAAALAQQQDIDPVVIELRKQFNAENGCGYWIITLLAGEVKEGTDKEELNNKCQIYYYDCMVTLLNEEAKTVGKNLTDMVNEKINQRIPLEKWCN